MKIVYDKDKILSKFINNSILKSFGWSDNQGTNFELTIENSYYNCINKLTFEFATEFEMQLSFNEHEDTIPIKYFKYCFNNNKYNISLVLGKHGRGYINFNCYSIDSQLVENI